MGLKKTGNNSATQEQHQQEERRAQPRDLEHLTEQLFSDNSTERRWAARDLADHPEAVELLSERIKFEKNLGVLEAIFNSMQHIGNEAVVLAMMKLLESKEAVMRNSAIEVLQALPEQTGKHITELLKHKNSDVRIFAIDILRVLAHPNTPNWLQEVLRNDNHVNVVGSAVDLIGEIGTADMADDLEIARSKFTEYKFIHFAIDAAKSRVCGAENK